jgi:hypothetical protein
MQLDHPEEICFGWLAANRLLVRRLFWRILRPKQRGERKDQNI